MKLSSLLSSIVSPQMRTNAILFFLVFFSLQSLISSVRLIPNEKIKAVWNNDNQFISCFRDDDQKGGELKWYMIQPRQMQIEDLTGGQVYSKHENNAAKLFLRNLSKKNAGVYECRHELDGNVVSSDRIELKVYNQIDMSERIGNKNSYLGTEGGSFTIPCTARFDPDTSSDSKQQSTTVSWFHNGRQIGEKDDQEFRVDPRNVKEYQSTDFKSIRSILTILNLNKEHEGTYLCQATFANGYLSTMEEIPIHLRVQFKPRFLEKTNKKVWIPESVAQGPVTVNVSCVVNSDPIASFEWFTYDDRPIPVEPNTHNVIPHMPRYSITNMENMSILSLTYEDISQIQRNFNEPDGRRKRFKCVAKNTIGNAKQDFAINIGKLPDPPILDSFSYEEGVLILSINKTWQQEVIPEVDLYRVEVDNRIPIYFNETFKDETRADTYVIPVEMPSGQHQLTLFAHNPVGWSELNNEIPSAQLIVRSASTVAQQYSALTLLASVMALCYAL